MSSNNTHVCYYCGKPFTGRRSLDRTHFHSYCGKECSHKAHSTFLRQSDANAIHLEQARKHIKRSTLEERVWLNVEKGSVQECWNWKGTLERNGYGVVRLTNAYSPREQAHRTVYKMLVGPISEGMTIDHLCRNHACVNPAHLEVVTLAENIRREMNFRRSSHCPHGHEYTIENTLFRKNGNRYCRACTQKRRREYHKAKKERFR